MANIYVHHIPHLRSQFATSSYQIHLLLIESKSFLGILQCYALHAHLITLSQPDTLKLGDLR